MSSFSLPLLLGIFAGAAGVVWLAGVKLSNSTDVLSSRLGLGHAFGGLIMLAVATNLPEIAITASAALAHNLGIAIGNILGGIAVQTVVLVALDAFGVRGKRPLTYLAASLSLVLEGALVISVLVVAVMGTRLPRRLVAFRVAPPGGGGLLIAVLWVVGVLLLSRLRGKLPWQEQGNAPGGQEKPRGHSAGTKASEAAAGGVSTARSAATFGVAALATLVAGVVLERSGEAIAGHIGMTGVLFGATILAAATSLPELSTGLASVKLGDYQLAFGDIFGGNAFLPVLFLMASVLSGQAVLPQASDTDVYLTALAVLLTTVYIWGLIIRPTKRFLHMGIDSMVVLVLYAVGIVGLVAIARK